MDATWFITTFVLIDTAMTNLDHQTDVRAKVPDSEVMTVALVAAKYFANNHHITLGGMDARRHSLLPTRAITTAPRCCMGCHSN